jgi:hypothetical protein
VSGPAEIMSVISVSPHVVKQIEGNCKPLVAGNKPVTLQKCGDMTCHWDSSSKICLRNSFNMSRYIMAFTLRSVYEKA